MKRKEGVKEIPKCFLMLLMESPLPEDGLGAGGGDVLEVVLELEDDLGEGELALDGALFLQVAEVDQVAVAPLLGEHEEVPPAVGDLAMPENKKYNILVKA